MCCAPFIAVRFTGFWLGDQLTSLALSLLDIEYLICWYTVDRGTLAEGACATDPYGIRAIVSLLPYWFRFAQCLRRYYDSRQAFPHLANAGKYATMFFVVLFASLHSRATDFGAESYWTVYRTLWIIAAVVQTSYMYVWDVTMDWSLMKRNVQPRWLRKEITYAPNVYYVAMVSDFVLRCTWTLTITPQIVNNLIPGQYFLGILATLEVFRCVHRRTPGGRRDADNAGRAAGRSCGIRFAWKTSM